MQSKRSRLDRFMRRQTNINQNDVKRLLAQGRIKVDGVIASSATQIIDQFSSVTLDAQLLQANTPRYIMMNKPVGVVSATKDKQHKTVMDLLENASHSDLHIAGRLDLNSSGLILLTNDGRWSRKLSAPASKITKRYRVTVKHPITEDYVQAFEQGMYFAYEDLTTLPVKLEIIGEHLAELSLVEGRYHQIKRMFGRFRNPVLSLHRFAIGEVALDSELSPGHSRALTASELAALTEATPD